MSYIDRNIVLLSFNFYFKHMNIDSYLSTLEKLEIIP